MKLISHAERNLETSVVKQSSCSFSEVDCFLTVAWPGVVYSFLYYSHARVLFLLHCCYGNGNGFERWRQRQSCCGRKLALTFWPIRIQTAWKAHVLTIKGCIREKAHRSCLTRAMIRKRHNFSCCGCKYSIEEVFSSSSTPGRWFSTPTWLCVWCWRLTRNRKHNHITVLQRTPEHPALISYLFNVCIKKFHFTQH